MVVPLYLLFFYGLLESFVILKLICLVSNLSVTKKQIIGMSLFKVITAIGLRQIGLTNMYIFSSLVIITTILIVWIFTKKMNIKVILTSVLTMVIIVLIEVPISIVGMKLLEKMDLLVLWLLTGLPHIVVLYLLAFFYERGVWNEKIGQEKAG